MPDLQDPGPGRKLQRRYRLIGTTPSPFLSPELVPVVIVDDLSDEEPTTRFATAADAVGATVGEQGQTRLRNPTGSGMIIENIVLEISRAAAGQWEVFQGGPTLTTGATEFWQDQAIAGSPQAQVTHGTDVGAVAERVARGNAGGTTQVTIPLLRFSLPPDTQLHFLGIGANIGLDYWWTWTERAIE